jgi:serine protease
MSSPVAAFTKAGGWEATVRGSEATDQLIVKFRSGSSLTSLKTGGERAAALGASTGMVLRHVRGMSHDGQVFKLPARVSLAEARLMAEKLRQSPGVEYALPDQRRFPLLTPADPYYPNQWHYQSPVGVGGGANLPAAWDITTGSASVNVAVIDTGIITHADLAGRIVPGYNFIHDKLVANNGIGRSADPADLGDWITAAEDAGTDPVSKDFFKGCGVSDSSWHGSHVAGTIGAASDNGAGVSGITWGSKILPVRVLGKCGGYDSDIIDGMRWAAGLPVTDVPTNQYPARVINMSLGGEGRCNVTDPTDPEYEIAQLYTKTISEVRAAGTVIVVAAGNEYSDASNYTPGGCNGVISVAAVSRQGGKAYYSNYGATVEIAAPGGAQQYDNDPNGILSVLNSGTTTPVASPAGDIYAYYQGTSMATPHVAGIVALMLSVNPDLTPDGVLDLLQSTARPFPTDTGSDCTTTSCGAGIVDASAAVQAAKTTAKAVDGVCGASNNGSFLTMPAADLCSAGDPTAVSGTGPWSWSCTGANGGSTALCSAAAVTPLTINNGAVYTTSKSVLLSVGTPSGFSSFRLSNNGTKWSKWYPIAAATSWKLASGDGAKTVHLQYRSPSGVTSDSFSRSIILDTKKPKGKLVINNRSKFTASRQVSLTFTATDVTSGLQGVCVREDRLPCADGEFVPFVPTMIHDIDSPDHGRKTIYATLLDAAGNRSSLLKASITLAE